MSAVLVTGGLGAIGSWVTRELVDQGKRAVSYDARLDTTLVKDIEDKFERVVGDVLDLPSIIHTIKHYEVERIIHMAAALPDLCEANPLMGFRINVEGTLNVFEAARLMDIRRVVYASSRSVYDISRGEYAHPTYKPIDEDYPKAPRDVYGATKLFAEHMGANYNRIYGLDAIGLRFAYTYGPGKQARGGTRAIYSRLVENAMLKKPLEIAQGGDRVDDLIYNGDIARGIVLACFAENPEHRIFHLGTGKGITLRDMLEVLNRVVGEVPIKIGPGLDFPGYVSRRNFVYNIDRARKELGFSPQYDLEKGVRSYIETMTRLGISPVLLP